MPENKPKNFPPQHQADQPGKDKEMTPEPQDRAEAYRGSGKMQGKIALVTGGDSGIGRAASIAFAKEGADVAIVYYDEHEDAATTKRLIEQAGRRCLTIAGDVGDESFCRSAVDRTVQEFGKLDVLVNNAAMQFPQSSIEDISEEQILRTFRSNIFSMFFMTKAAMRHLKEGAAIVNTTSVTAFRGSPHLLDYSATKGAILAFTRSLSGNLADRKVRVNCVAPGPIWTPLIPSSFDAEHVKEFGKDVPLGRAGQPDELAPAYVYLACSDSSYMTGQTLHINGGELVGG